MLIAPGLIAPPADGTPVTVTNVLNDGTQVPLTTVSGRAMANSPNGGIPTQQVGWFIKGKWYNPGPAVVNAAIGAFSKPDLPPLSADQANEVLNALSSQIGTGIPVIVP